MASNAQFSIFPKAPDTARTSSSASAAPNSLAPSLQKRPKSANPAPLKRGLKYKNQNILPAGNDFLRENEQFAPYAPSNNNHMNKDFNGINDNLMPREDILGNLHEAKRRIKSLEGELSQQKAENQRMALELAKQQKRLEKVVQGAGNNHHMNNNNNGRNNHVMMEVFKEVEKSSLVRHLKQELTTIRDLFVEKENELEMINKTNKGVYIMELKSENGECLNEIARQRAIISRQADEIALLKKKLVSSSTVGGNHPTIGDVEKSELRKEISRLASGYESILSGYCNSGNTKLLSSLHYGNQVINDNASASNITTDNASVGDSPSEDRDSCAVRGDEQEEVDSAVNTSANSSVQVPNHSKVFKEKKRAPKKESRRTKSKLSAANRKTDNEIELLNCFDYDEATRDEGIRMAVASKNDYEFADGDDDNDDDDNENMRDDGVSVGNGQREEMLKRLMEDIDSADTDRGNRFTSTDNYEDDFDDFDD